MKRRLAFGLLAAGAVVVALVVLVHTPIVRRAALRYAVGIVERDYGIRVEASRLDYNLFSLRVGLADVRVGARLPAEAGSHASPFFEADYVSVLIPRRTLFGDVFIDDVAVTNGLIRIVRGADGTSNLPATRDGGDQEPAPLPIGRLAVTPLRVEITDAGSRFALAIPSADVALARDEGHIALGAPASLRVGDRGTTFAQIAGDARFDGRTLNVRNLQIDADEGRLRLDGALTLIARQPSLDLQVSGTGDLARLAAWGVAASDAPRGEVAFNGRVGGPLTVPTATFDGRSPRVVWQEVVIRNAAVRGQVSAERLDVERLDADFQGGHVGGTFGLPLTADGGLTPLDRLQAELAIALDTSRPFFSPLALPGESRLHVAQGTWQVEGRHRVGNVAPATIDLLGRLGRGDLMRTTVVGQVRVAGTDAAALVAALRRAGLVDVPAEFTPEGIMRAHIGVAGTLSRATLTVDAVSPVLRLQEPAVAGPATVLATVDTASQRYTFEGTVAGLVTPTSEWPAAGNVDLAFKGSGRAAEVAGRADLVARNLAYDGIPLGGATAQATLADGSAVVAVQAADVDLAPIAARFDSPVPLTGRVSLAADASGRVDDWRRGMATVVVSALDARAGDVPLRLRQPAQGRYDDGRVFVDVLEGDVGETRVSAFGNIAAFDGPPGDGVVVTVTGSVDEVARTVAATGLTDVPVTGGSGPVALLARVSGSIERPDVSADLEVGPGSVTLLMLPPITGVRARAHAEGGWLELREAEAVYQGAALTATARAPIGGPGEYSLRARVAGITAAVLQPFVDSASVEEIAGSIDATVAIDAPALALDAVRGELTIDRLDIRVADLPVTQRVPTRIAARDGFARVEAWDWVGQGATLGVAGQVRLTDQQAAILANGEVDLRMLTPFVRDAGLATAGVLRPRLSITGSLADPRVDGDLLLADGEARLVEPRVLLTALNGRAVLTRSTATLTALEGTINGGTLSVEGSAGFQPGAATTAQLAARIDGMALDYPVGLRSEIDGALQLEVTVPPGGGVPAEAGHQGDAVLRGTVTMVRGAYREPLAVVAGLLANARAATAAAAAGVEGAGLLDALRLDVRLLTDEDIRVDNNYGRFALGADLRIIGTAATPALSGRAELREGGQLFVGRNVYTIRSGSIDFVNPLTIEPTMNLALETRAGGEDIEVTISGTPDAPTVVLAAPTSDTPLGQADITALLLTGRRLDQLGSADAAMLGAQVLGNFGADVLGFAGRAIGLDTLRFGGVQTTDAVYDPAVLTTELDPTSRLTFGKTLGTTVDVTYSQSLRDGDAQTWIIDYLPSRRIALRFVSNDDTLNSLSFRHDLSFGGPPRQAVTREPRPEERVAAIDIDDRLRGLLSLEVGDRFDFGEWQRDRDRLLERYQQDGYLTARVDATRSEGPDVTLTYAVSSGPRTAIVVSGITPSAALLAELRRAWMDSVYDAFLVDEATEVVRQALAGDGYLQPSVKADVTRSGGTATLAVIVEPGVQTTAASIRIEGADGELAAALDEVVERERLATRAIAEPAAVEGALTVPLRRMGYARARVVVGAPRFEGSAAVVPVTVSPGPALRFGAPMVAGAGGLDRAQVLEAAGIIEGAPADPAVIDAAQQRVGALYRSEGFSRAAIVARQAVVEDSGTLDVTFEISEGPRQVLGDIVIAGNRGIDTDVIERALRLEPDQPLRPADWLQARTRVFETGLFRRVDVTPELLADRATPERAPVRMQVTVEEWPALRARYGLQVAEERPEDNVKGRDLVPGLSGDITRRTLFGRAVTIGAAAGLQRRERLGRAFVNAPTMAGLPVRSSLIVERARRDFAAATLVTDTTGIAWEQRVRTTPRLNLSYAYRFERNHTFDTQPRAGDIPFDILVDVARLTANGAWDTRDDQLDTMRGTLLSSSVELAAQRLGSDISYVRSLSQAYHFRPWRGLVFASAARAGVVQPLGGQELIPSVRFYAGGARTVRGVEEDSLGERDFFGDPVGGEGLLVLNQEVRFPLYRWLRGVAFVDIGGVFSDPTPRWGDMKTSIGAGLRVTTPFGVLRADYAGRFTIGIGQAF